MSSKKQKLGGASSSKRTPQAPKVESKVLYGKGCHEGSSVESKVLYGEGCHEGRITFRLNNEDHVLGLVQINSIYGLPLGGERKVPNDFNEGEFWYALTGSSFYTPSATKASHIHNPCFKYIHRVMANSVFGRGESFGNVRQTELFLLWAMVNALPVDTGSHLACQFSKVGKAMTGDIVIGGFITPIAQAFNIDLSNDRKILGDTSRALDDDLAHDAPASSSFQAGPSSGPLSQLSASIAKIEAAQEQQRLQLEAFRAEQREQIQNIESMGDE
ncbi:hypothetical protein SESBI_29828 [Sesbania bispinosa]|nr:hypothetical protein SESBI_29828 [Sesbania bispinosa]